MKNIILIFTLILSTYGCKAQIIPVEDLYNYTDNLPEGAYVKDVNHVLDKFVGTWTGSYNNKDYEIVIEKDIDVFLQVTFDQLLLRYKITDAQGNIIINTLSLPDEDSSCGRRDSFRLLRFVSIRL